MRHLHSVIEFFETFLGGFVPTLLLMEFVEWI